VIAHAHTRGVRVNLERHRHFAILGGKLDRVGEEVGENLNQPVLVARDVGRVRGAQRDAHMVLRGVALHPGDRRFQHSAKVAPVVPHDDRARFDLLDIEDVVDEPDEAFRILVRDVK
jgi:hypothetical protein